jgi:hypothetical protein
MAPSARGSHACKSPLDDTTYEAFSVICTPALALTAMRSLRGCPETGLGKKVDLLDS